MNPILFNCVFLYVTVILLSLLQSRFRLIKDEPLTYFLLLLIMPILIAGKAKGIKTWTELTVVEIFGYTLVIAFFNAKRILPRINEGYIYAYTLFHWYLLLDTIHLKGLNFWTSFVIIISVYPTYLIIRSSFEHKVLEQKNKIILYYWFLTTIAFTYADQVALHIIQPVTALRSINFTNSLIVLLAAIQLYFIATIFSLLFVGIPFFHLDRSSDKWKVRWKRAMADWRDILNHKLDNYIEYQISVVQVFYITVLSGILFYIDIFSNFRQALIFIYTVAFPVLFFYIKWTPEKNIEQEL